jgi:hypothetical protein
VLLTRSLAKLAKTTILPSRFSKSSRPAGEGTTEGGPHQRGRAGVYRGRDLGATLDHVGNVALFAASDRARSVTATALNITCGSVVD